MAQTVGTETTSQRARRIARRLSRNENAVLAAILAAIIAMMAGLSKGFTVTPGNISNIWLQSSIRGIASVGQLFVILTGGIDIAVGGTALLTAVLGASFMTEELSRNIIGSPIGLAAGLGAMLAIGLGVGFVNGLLVSRVGVPALIVTLGMWQITKGGAFIVCRGAAIYKLPEGLEFFGSGEVAGVPVPTIIFIAVAVVAFFVLNHTSYGRSVYATGGNSVSAWLSGIKVNNIYLSVFTISGFLAALASIVYIGRAASASYATAAGLELDSITAVFLGGTSILGGRGSLIGAVIGVMILGVINNGMNVLTVDPSFQGLIKGVILIAAVAIDMQRRRRG
jgi:ribose transport system permease protein